MKLRLPSILGWLITGMVLGPHAFGFISQSMLDARWFNIVVHILECTFGLMIGTELIWKTMKKAGKQIVVTTITESLGTFVVVSLVFGVIFYFSGVPVYLAFMFGGIALATAPAPSLSIVNDMKTAGPVTNTLIPMAALDDLVGAAVFFTVIALVSAGISTQGISVFAMLFYVFLPVFLGIITGFITGKLLRLVKGKKASVAVMVAMLLLSGNRHVSERISIAPCPVINFMLIGMSFSTVFANMISEEQLDIMDAMNSRHWPGADCGHPQPGRTPGLPSHLWGRRLYGGIHRLPRHRQILGRIYWRARDRRAGHCAPVSGLHAFAALGRFAGVYRHCRIRIERACSGVRLDYSGYHRGGGSHQ